jgi:hypothetical protein
LQHKHLLQSTIAPATTAVTNALIRSAVETATATDADLQTPLSLHPLLSQKIVQHKEAHNEYHGEYNVIGSKQNKNLLLNKTDTNFYFQRTVGSPDPKAKQTVRECLTAVCKALSLANAKGKGTDGLVIRS